MWLLSESKLNVTTICCDEDITVRKWLLMVAQMELPFTGFELAFILIAFMVFSLLSLVSIYYQSDASKADRHAYEPRRKPLQLNRKHKVISKDEGQKPLLPIFGRSSC
ncbi:unnamed protein product [Lota lota]